MLWLPGAARAVGPYTLAEGDATGPDVIVDAAGTAHVVWTHEGSGNPTPITYCQVPRGAHACSLTRDIAFPGLSSTQGPFVFLDGAKIRVVAQRFDEKVYVATSGDGGNSFDTPATPVGEPPHIAPLQDAVADPSGALYLLYAGIFQKTSFDAGATTTAFAEVGAPGFAYGQSIALWTGGGVLAAWSDLHEVAYRYSFPGDPNVLANWTTNLPLYPGGFEGPVLSSEGSTAYLVYEGVYDSGGSTRNGGVRASLWGNSPAAGFAGPVRVSDGNEVVANTLDAFVDGAGVAHVLWGTPTLGDGFQHLRYASLDELEQASPPVTIARSDRIPAFVDGQVAVGPDGEGLAVFEGGSIHVATLDPIGGATGKGTAVAGRLIRVMRGKALLRLRCRGGGRCRGVARLVARVRAAPAGKRNHGDGAKKRGRRVLIGKARFAIPAGKRKLIRVGLNRKGKRLLRRAPRHRLKVRLTGSGVKHRALVLREVRRQEQRK